MFALVSSISIFVSISISISISSPVSFSFSFAFSLSAHPRRKRLDPLIGSAPSKSNLAALLANRKLNFHSARAAAGGAGSKIDRRRDRSGSGARRGALADPLAARDLAWLGPVRPERPLACQSCLGDNNERFAVFGLGRVACVTRSAAHPTRTNKRALA